MGKLLIKKEGEPVGPAELKILMVEDMPYDVELIKHEITKSGIRFVEKVVESKEEYVSALQEFLPDLILSDFSLPSFNGLEALFIREEMAPLVPFILVTGTINEETAVEVMKAGADDYIIKEHITRLGSSIKAAFEKKEAIRQKIKADESLKILSLAVEQNPASIMITNTEGDIEYVNPKFSQVTGYSEDEIIGQNPRILKSGKIDPLVYKELWKTILAGREWHGEFPNKKKNGEIFYESASIMPITDQNGQITHFLAVKEDVSEQKRARAEILKNEDRFKQVAECSGTWVWEVDTQGLYTYVSESGSSIVGYRPEEVVGKKFFYDFFAPEVKKELTKAAFEVFARKETFQNFENPNIRKDGRLVILETSGLPILDEQGNLLGYRGADRDITERKQNDEEIIRAKEKAEESDRLKSALLNNMSHEIRTPMNAIMGFSDLMETAEGDEKNEYATIIRQSSRQLLSLIDDIIQLSRLQSEKLPLNITELEPAELIKEVSRMFNLPEMRNGLEIILTIPTGVRQLSIRSDADKIRQAMTNYVSNALKYTRQGSVELGFDLNGNWVEFWVKDTGMGIPEPEQQQVFDSFYRGQQVIASAIRGTGLGLSITKELIDLLGGKVGVTSAPGQGSRFYFSIPYVPAAREVSEKPASPLPGKPLGELSVLVVDDEQVNYLYLEILLKNKVKRVKFATNGREAIEMVAADSYDLVLMDMKMPVMGGIEATQILKQQYPGLPVIAQTAYALPEEKASALQAGCDDFLAKPIKKEALFEMIGRYV